MKYQLIGYGDAPLPAWAASVQAQLTALDAGPRARWRRFRRCDVICESCREQLAQVMNTEPPVVVTRKHLNSSEHPHAVAAAAALPAPSDGDPRALHDHLGRVVDTHELAAHRARVSSTHSWWQALDMLPKTDAPGWDRFNLHCKCRTVPITRDELLAVIDGRSHVLM